MCSARARLKDAEVRIDKDGIRAQVARVLRQAIIAGEFLPGQRLVEMELCDALQISRPSLREALRHLESERLVDFIPNRGCFVATLAWEDAAQIYDTRLLLEPEMVSRAATRIGAAELAELEEALEQFKAAAFRRDKLAQVAASDRFYQVIFGAAGNAIVKEVLEGLNARISVMRGRSMSHPDRAANSLVELEAICNAIAARDAEAARAAARRHIENACAAAKAAMHGDAAAASTGKRASRKRG